MTTAKKNFKIFILQGNMTKGGGNMAKGITVIKINVNNYNSIPIFNG